MKVLFDHQVFDSQVYEGASRYFVELARHLMPEGVAIEFAVRQTDNAFLHADPRLAKKIIRHPRPNPLVARLRELAARAGIIPYMSVIRANENASLTALKAGNFDMFHPTYYEPYFLPYLNHKPFVVTVHDMIHELFPQYVKPGNPTTQWKQKVLAAASHIISVSENTKKDLVRLLNINPEKITVIHHGVGSPFSSPTPSNSPSGRGRNYLLYLGARDRYKNFACLLEALPSILRQQSELQLVCVGGGVFTAAEKEHMRKLGVARHIEQCAATDEELATLYRSATAFVFPSLYEGFGMPILEAFACACPAVLAGASAFPEVAADAALYFDPHQPEELARVLQDVVASPSLQAKLRQAGAARAKFFTWQKAAGQTKQVYSMLT